MLALYLHYKNLEKINRKRIAIHMLTCGKTLTKISLVIMKNESCSHWTVWKSKNDIYNIPKTISPFHSNNIPCTTIAGK